jgi:hypothetical protein
MPANAGRFTSSYEMTDFLTSELKDSGRDEGPVIIVFANAQEDFVKKNIFPYLRTWNFRSGKYVSILFPGYLPSDDCTKDQQLDESLFDEEWFVDMISNFERYSDFVYRGETPVMICRTFLKFDEDYGEQIAVIDYGTAVVFSLQAAIRDKIVSSTDAFIEAAVRVARTTPESESYIKIGEILRNNALKNALIDQVASRLKGADKILWAQKYFHVTTPKLG